MRRENHHMRLPIADHNVHRRSLYCSENHQVMQAIPRINEAPRMQPRPHYSSSQTSII
jgi:hypothetical protein